MNKQAHEIVALVGSSITGLLMQVASLAILSNFATINEFANYGKILVFGSVLGLALNPGLIIFAVREIGSGSNVVEIVVSILSLRLVISVACGIFMLVSTLVFNFDFYFTMAVISQIFVSLLTVGWIFQSQQKYFKYSLYQMVNAMCSLMPVLLFTIGLISLTTIFLLTSFLMLLVTTFVLRDLDLENIKILKLNNLAIFKKAFPLAKTSILISLAHYIPVGLFWVVFDDNQFAIYFGLIRLIEIFIFAPTLINTYFYPKISVQNTPLKLSATLQYLNFSTALILTICIIKSYWGPKLLRLFNMSNLPALDLELFYFCLILTSASMFLFSLNLVQNNDNNTFKKTFFAFTVLLIASLFIGATEPTKSFFLIIIFDACLVVMNIKQLNFKSKDHWRYPEIWMPALTSILVLMSFAQPDLRDWMLPILVLVIVSNIYAIILLMKKEITQRRLEY